MHKTGIKYRKFTPSSSKSYKQCKILVLYTCLFAFLIFLPLITKNYYSDTKPYVRQFKTDANDRPQQYPKHLNHSTHRSNNITVESLSFKPLPIFASDQNLGHFTKQNSNTTVKTPSPKPLPISISLKSQESPFALSALVLLRIFAADQMQHTFREVREWMEWLFHAGVEHIFVYDNWHQHDENILDCLQPYIDRGLVTHHNFHHPTRPYAWVQAHAYAHWLQHYRNKSTWQITLDMDEYPHIFNDSASGFLLRLAQKSQCTVYFQNQFWLGLPQNKSDGQLLMERFVRKDRNYERYPYRSKVMYRVEHVTKILVHSVDTHGCSGHDIVSIAEGALEHFWGSRGIHGNPAFDVNRFMKNTEENFRMLDVGRDFKGSHVPRIWGRDLKVMCRLGGW